MRVIAIIQARTTSSRLPGKVLMPIAGRPMLACEIERVQQSSVDEIVVATTTHAADDPIVDLARRLDVRWFRGSESDVLERFVGAAREAMADVIVRLTADCPLIDAAILDRVVCELVDHSANCDYAANILERTYPRGLDVEAFYSDTLFRIDRLAQSEASREHVTIVPRSERPALFMRRSVKDTQDNSDLRWTVDTLADLELVRSIYEQLDLLETPTAYRQLLEYVRSHDELARFNSEVTTWDPMRRAG